MKILGERGGETILSYGFKVFLEIIVTDERIFASLLGKKISALEKAVFFFLSGIYFLEK